MESAVSLIGYGTASVNAAIALRSAGYDGPIRVFSDTAEPPISPVLLSDYAGGALARVKCAPWVQEDLDALDLEVHADAAVVGLDVHERIIHTQRGDFPFSKCLIASGSHPRSVGFPALGPDAGSAPCLRTIADADRLHAQLRHPACTHAIICGTSMVALKAVDACLMRGVAVTLVGRGNRILRRVAHPHTARLFQEGLERLGVTFRLSAAITEASVAAAQDEGLPTYRIRLDSGEELEAQALIVAHGMEPNLAFLDGGLAVDETGGLAVDEHMRTAAPDVFAAGDVASVPDLATGARCIAGLWKDACLQGAAAGRTMAADLAGRQAPAAYLGTWRCNSVIVRNIALIAGGHCADADDSGLETQVVHHADGMAEVRSYAQGSDGARRLVGFNVLSDDADPSGDAYDVAAMLRRRMV